MVFKRLKKRIELEKEKLRLEDQVMRFMKKVTLLQEEQPKLAYRFLCQATNTYHNKLGYTPEIDPVFDLHFRSFIEMYPPKVTRKPNPALV